MKKARILSLSVLSMLALSLGACGQGGGPSSSGSEGKKYFIGVCQLVTHDALDAATNGFIDAVKEGLGEANVTIEKQNAAGEPATCNTIVNNFVNKNVDLIMANATPALQAAAEATETIPVLGTSITEYGVALNIKDFSGVTGFNVSGTSDLAPLKEQASMLHTIIPNATKVGLLYCSGEANSKYQIDVVDAELKGMGLTTEIMAFSDSNDISAVIEGGLAKGIDALYIPTDNTAASNAGIIADKCENIPIVAGEEGICKGTNAVITLSISYYNIGKKTGEMAVDILKNGADITKMRIEYDQNPVKKYNKEACEKFNLTVPSDYVEL